MTAAFAVSAAPSRAIDRSVSRRVQPASVQLGPLYTMKDPRSGKKVMGSISRGSGTVLSADGYILTNHHVTDLKPIRADAKANGVEFIENTMVVSITKRNDEPPIPMFRAAVIATDPRLDLAVLKVTSDLSGAPLSSGNVFPWVPVGDATELELGDTLNIFGYPSIGGRTITYTSGPVSGFETDPAFAGRAWIKTSASISGGNSGGTAVDDSGFLVGIPTQGGVLGAQAIVDCRPAADTNGDRKLDDKDVCVPTGGFINSLRTVNTAKQIITRATNGTVKVSGLPPGATAPTTAPRRPAGPTAPPTTSVLPTVTPPAPARPTTPSPTAPSPTAPNTSNAADVEITVRVSDAGTGRPIPNATFFVLRAGVTWATIDRSSDRDLFAVLSTDQNGVIVNPSLRIPRGQKLSMGISAEGYRGVTADDILIPASGDDPLLIDVKLERA
jgi:S1-C subfamily serine protease